eukprot:m.78790 g.78790  ORF g.78790 m.78790 type:complete len:427 (-) comp14760_c0_seq3:283-1563(-)
MRRVGYAAIDNQLRSFLRSHLLQAALDYADAIAPVDRPNGTPGASLFRLAAAAEFAEEHAFVVKAMELLLAVWRSAQREVDSKPYLRMAAYRRLGKSLCVAGHVDRAREVLDQALQMQQAMTGEQHGETARLCISIAECYSAAGDFEAALQMRQRALQICLATSGPQDASTAAAYGNVATSQLQLEDYATALQTCSAALAALPPAFPRAQELNATLYNLKGLIHCKMGDSAKAQQALETALENAQAVRGPNTKRRQTNAIYNNLAIAMRGDLTLEDGNGSDEGEGKGADDNDDEKKKKIAERCTKALEYHGKALALAAVEKAPALSETAITYHFLGDFQKAAALYGRALHLAQRQCSPDHPFIAGMRANLAASLEGAGRHAEALAAAEAALPVLTARFGPAHRATQRCEARRNKLKKLMTDVEATA